jgi:hypothetical protein
MDEGTPQGGPLSPLRSNLVFEEWDRELERRGLRFARYADDCNIYVRSRRAGERVMASVTRFLAGKRKLTVNQHKSTVARPWERKFLGFSFTWHRQPKRRMAPRALARFKERVRELTRRTPVTCGVGWVISGGVKRHRCYAVLRSGPGAGCGRCTGSSGNEAGFGLPNFAGGVWGKSLPRKRWAVPMALGESPTPRLLRWRCPMLTLTRSGFRA